VVVRPKPASACQQGSRCGQNELRSLHGIILDLD
jgi:hypothetical protein